MVVQKGVTSTSKRYATAAKPTSTRRSPRTASSMSKAREDASSFNTAPQPATSSASTAAPHTATAAQLTHSNQPATATFDQPQSQTNNLQAVPSPAAQLPTQPCWSSQQSNSSTHLATPAAAVQPDCLQQILGTMTALMQQNQQMLQQLSLRQASQQATPSSPAPSSLANLRPAMLLNDTVLRKVQLQTFDGEDPAKFPAFWNSFNHRINQADYSDIDKFEALRGLLCGNALKKLGGLDACQPGAFQEASRILQINYGDVQEQKSACYKRLLGMQRLLELEYHALEEFTDELRLTLGQLTRLGEPPAAIDAYVFAVWPKLPVSLQMDIQDQRVKAAKAPMPSMSELQDYLDIKLRALRAAMQAIAPSAPFAGASLFNAALSTRSGLKPRSNHIFKPSMSKKSTTRSSINGVKISEDQGHAFGNKCIYCDETDHDVFHCTRVSSPDAKLKILRRKKLCFNCLRGHEIQQCFSRFRCRECKDKHHTTIHGATLSEPKRSTPSAHSTSTTPKTNSHLNAAMTPESQPVITNTSQINAVSCFSTTQDGHLGPSVMATFTAPAVNPCTGTSTPVSALIDGGSSYTYLKRDIARKLDLKVYGKVTLDSSSCHSATRRRVQAEIVLLELSTKDGRRMPIKALSTEVVAPSIHLPALTLPKDIQATLACLPQEVQNLPPADDEETELDLIIGSDYAQLLIGPGIGAIPLRPTFTAHLTPFGIILTGSLEGTHGKQSGHILTSALFSNVRQRNLERLVDRMTSLDLLGLEKGAEVPHLQDERTKQLIETIVRGSDGRFSVALPLKPGSEELPSNFGQAFGRAEAVHRRLSHEQRDQYYGEFNKRIKEGVLEPVDGTRQARGQLAHVLPHFPVFKQTSNTTKVRPVVDASAPTSLNGMCLNDLLETGPNLLTSLLQVQLRLRIFKHACVSDLQSAFYQISVHPEFRDALRIILPKDHSKPLGQDNWQLWRFTRIVMGASPSPWILQAVIHKLCLDAVETGGFGLTSQEIASIPSGLYVDNLVTGYDKSEEGPRLVNGLRALFRSACFNLREFASNDRNALVSVPMEDQISCAVVKNLGITWDTSKDTLRLSKPDNLTTTRLTRASLLSAVCKIYDPFGYAAPLLLAGRLLYHKAFKSHDPWDKPADAETVAAWTKLLQELTAIDRIVVPRCCIEDRTKPSRLVVFSDGSLQAYGCVVYLQQTVDSQSNCNLILAKTRLVPSGKKNLLITIPRIELWAALIANRTAVLLQDMLAPHVNIVGVTHYIDSQIVLHWIQNGSNLRPYEERRVQEIRNSKLTTDRRYVHTSDNPADYCTKPPSLSQLIDSNFYKGPAFLRQPYEDWPSWKPSSESKQSDGYNSAEKRVCHATTLITSATMISATAPSVMDINRFARLNCLTGATSYVIRFTKRITSKGIPDAAEREAALMLWVKHVQEVHFADAFAALTKGRHKVCKLIHQFDLFEDQDGYLRLGSRLTNATLSADSTHPILLPADHRLTSLIILYIHRQEEHASAGTVLSRLRERFWIARGLSTVRTVVRGCWECRLSKSTTIPYPPHGQLPAERLDSSQPAFHSILVDQLGPIYTFDTKTQLTRKRWALILSCATSRAVHIEPLHDYSGDAVLHAFERFWARRGLTEGTIFLDQATAFQATAKVIDSLLTPAFQHKLYNDLQPFVAVKKLRFKFAPARAPWHQGAVERMVAMVKSSLRPALWRRRITDEELVTLLCKIEAVINTRPLTSLSSDPKDPRPLTPACLIAQSSRLDMPSVPEANILPTGSTAADRLRAAHRRREQIVDCFWQRWRREYVQHLQSVHLNNRTRFQPSRVAPHVGQFYLLAENTPRGTWKTCRIIATHPDPSGIIRYVTVRTSTGHESCRATAHLVPLEADIDSRSTVTSATGTAADATLPMDDKGLNTTSDPAQRGDISARAQRAQRRNIIRNALMD